VRFPIHLSNEQNVIIKNVAIEKAMISALNQITMLIDYFSLNSRDEKAKQYLYVEIPCYYTFKKKKSIKDMYRIGSKVIYYNCMRRMYTISPTQTKLFMVIITHCKKLRASLT